MVTSAIQVGAVVGVNGLRVNRANASARLVGEFINRYLDRLSNLARNFNVVRWGLFSLGSELVQYIRDSASIAIHFPITPVLPRVVSQTTSRGAYDSSPPRGI